MALESKLKPRLKNINDLFDISGGVTMVTMDKLIPFKNHPFRLYSGDRLTDLVRSIKELGVIVPVIVRPNGDDTFIILSGHNRVNAARLAGLPSVPVIIKEDLNDEEAKLIVTETNLVQRSFADLSHSERAIALRHHMDAIRRQGKRNDLIKEIDNLLYIDETGEEGSSSLVDTKSRSSEITGAKYGLSSATVARYVRISYLIEALQQRVDDGEIGLYSAVSLSYLKEDEQTNLNNLLDETACRIDMQKANELHIYSKRDILNNDKIRSVLLDTDVKKTKSTARPVKIKYKIYSKYFATGTKANDIEAIIDQALSEYFEKRKNKPDN